MIKQAILKSFDAVSFTATVRISGSYKSYLEGITVARNIPAAEMVAGRDLAVIFFDDYNPSDAVIIAVF